MCSQLALFLDAQTKQFLDSLATIAKSRKMFHASACTTTDWSSRCVTL
ncbi:hypothetical protein SH467x_002703 [Pirellulaceae bacterium SH467]